MPDPWSTGTHTASNNDLRRKGSGHARLGKAYGMT